MPRISEFFGIVISMYYNDHEPPHFHAAYAEFEAVVSIDSLDLLHGNLPTRCWSLVLEWGWLRRAALQQNWERARSGLPLEPVPPLE